MNPIALFKRWFRDAQKAKIAAPESMTLVTARRNGKPSARMVLLKGVEKNGFVFFTNYQSRKSKELDENPHVTLLFFWEKLMRQVRVEGRVQKVTRKESESYFATRPRGSQIGAWASQQSRPLSSRKELLKRVQEFERKFEGRPVPCPPHWGGYRVIPNRIEFWTGYENRLHDRLEFRRTPLRSDLWTSRRLNP